METKKKDAYLIRYAFLPQHIMANCWDLFGLYLEVLGGEFLEGAAPKGSLFDVGKKASK